MGASGRGDGIRVRGSGMHGEWRDEQGADMCRGAVVRGKGRAGEGWGVDYLRLA